MVQVELPEAWDTDPNLPPRSDITMYNLNIDNVLGASEPALSQNLTRLFANLLERNQDHTYVQNYTVFTPPAESCPKTKIHFRDGVLEHQLRVLSS
jgi:hypothetical protein